MLLITQLSKMTQRNRAFLLASMAAKVKSFSFYCVFSTTINLDSGGTVGWEEGGRGFARNAGGGEGGGRTGEVRSPHLQLEDAVCSRVSQTA